VVEGRGKEQGGLVSSCNFFRVYRGCVLLERMRAQLYIVKNVGLCNSWGEKKGLYSSRGLRFSSRVTKSNSMVGGERQYPGEGVVKSLGHR